MNNNIFTKKHFMGYWLLCCFMLAFTYSPAQPKLFYFSDKTGSYQLYTSDTSGNNEIQLINDPGYNYWWLSVSPDYSKLITYRSDTATGQDQNDYEHAELWIYDIDGNNGQLLIDTSTYHWEAHGVAKFSPDGSRILMAAAPNNAGQYYGFVTDSLGQNPQQISPWWIIDPAWSPDGNRIVFSAFPGNNISLDFAKLEIHTASFDHITNTINSPLQVTTGTGRVHDPCYSHSGEKIAFSSGNLLYTQADIMVIDTNGANPDTLFSDNGASGGSIFWSCDDSEVWFHNVTLFVNPFEIRKVNVSTGKMTTILESLSSSYISPQMACQTSSFTDHFSDKPSIRIVPNPAGDRITFSGMTHYNACFVVRIFHLSGREMLRSTTCHRDIDISSLHQGFYLVNLHNAAYDLWLKLVVD